MVLFFSTSSDSLQKSIHVMHRYCIKWKLSVNSWRVNILYLGLGFLKVKFRNLFVVKMYVVSDYNYLGIKLHRNRRPLNQRVIGKRFKAMFSSQNKARSTSLPLECLFSLFDVLLTPILQCDRKIKGYEITTNFFLNGSKTREQYPKLHNLYQGTAVNDKLLA